MGFSEDLLFIRVQIPTASLPLAFAGRPLSPPARINVSTAQLPDFRLPHYLSHLDPVTVELASLPLAFAGRPLSPPTPVEVSTAQLPDFRLPRYVSHLDPVMVELATLPLAFTGRDLSHSPSLFIALASLPAELLAIGRQDGVGLSGAPDSLQFVMSAATDSRGNQWFGCEDSGVFC